MSASGGGKVEGMTAERFAVVRRLYWVLAYDGEMSFYWYWLFRVEDEPPPPVPNPRMHWRRPTYTEAVERQCRWQRDPEEFDRQCRKWAATRRRVRRSRV